MNFSTTKASSNVERIQQWVDGAMPLLPRPPYNKPEQRPKHVDYDSWRDRCKIAAKLGPDEYSALVEYARHNDMNINSATRAIFRFFFQLD